jgi:hypothetical protein
VNTTVKTILMGLAGLALAVLLSLGAFALAGRSLGEPPTAVPAPSPSAAGNGHGPSGDDASPSGTPTHQGSASPTVRPSASPSVDDHGGGSADDHSGSGSGGGGSDDPPGDDHGGGDPDTDDD